MVARVSNNGADVVVCVFVNLCVFVPTYLCRSLSVSVFVCTQLLYVLPLSAVILSVPGVIRETHTAGIRASTVDERGRAQYCYTTLNTLPHTPWLEPHTGHHRGAHFIDASARCSHSSTR